MNVDRVSIPGIVTSVALKSREHLLNGFSLNIGGLLNNIGELSCVLREKWFDFACISETFLDEGINDIAVAVDGFDIFRNDRAFSPLSRGGVAIYLRKGIKCKIVEVPVSISSLFSSDIEFLFLELVIGVNKCLIGVIYNPPVTKKRSYGRVKNSIGDLQKLFEFVTLPYRYSLIAGDFNFDLFKKTCSFTKAYLEVLDMLGLFVHNKTISTHCAGSDSSPSLIDHVLVSDENLISYFDQVSSVGSSHHELLFFSLNLTRPHVERCFYYRDFKNFNLGQAAAVADSLEWGRASLVDDISNSLGIINDNINIMFDACVPIKKFTPRNDRPPWLTGTIRTLIRDKNHLFTKWKRFKSKENWLAFTQARNKLVSLVRKTRADFLRDKCDPSLPSKQFWANVKNMGIGKRKEESSVAFSPVELNDHFGKSFNPGSVSYNDPTDLNCKIDGFHFRAVEIDELWSGICSLKSSSLGLDNVDIRFIKLIFPIVGLHLLNFFNLVFTHSRFPTQWKKSIIIPIPKTKRPSCLGDFRPISILCSLSKVFEKLMKNQMLLYLNSNSLFCELQSGYRKCHSTSSAVLKVVDDIRVGIDSGKLTFLCLLDYSKAFDTVIYDTLCRKLADKFDFSMSAILLIHSYLTGRTQTVRVNGEYSDEACVSSGVPQGSVLGPLLFCLYIADVESVIKHSSFHLFADDLQLYRSCDFNSESISSCVSHINEDLTNIAKWSSDNGLRLNGSKTQSIVFSKRGIDTYDFPKLVVNDVQIQYSSSVKNLGVLLSHDLKWDAHVNSVCKKIFFMLRTLWRVTHFADAGLRRRLFLSYILPHFLYADVVFFGMSGRCRDKLLRCFKAGIRYVFRLKKFDHISEFENRLVGCSLFSYLDFRVCWYIKTLLQLKLPSYLYNKFVFSREFNVNLRLNMEYRPSYCSNSSFFGSGVKMWNALSLRTRRSASRSVFFERYLEDIRDV